ncbi:MAG: HAD family hydrolase [Smithellaceae bacterium]|nr:HAD family hydrolase [Smithellaceae bacterium]
MTTLNPQTKLLLFDFDGVLVDSLEIYAKSMIATLEIMGKPIIKNREDYLALFEENLYAALERRGLDLGEFFTASSRILEEIDYLALQPFFPLIPVLKKLQEEHSLLVISSNSTEVIRNTLTRHDFADCFRDILGADRGLGKKEKIEQVMARENMPRERTYYIGDTTGDIREAKQAGVRTVAAAWGWHGRERLAAAGPDYLLDCPQELLSLAGAARP